ncbi:MAG TPA: hypothetical protein VGC82_04960 [Rhodopila sp.]
MSDLTLLLLAADIVALLLLGAFGRLVPSTGSGLPAAALCGLGALLCLPVLILRLRAAALVIPIGPPGLSLHLALDPLSTIFLAIVLVAGTAVAAFQAASVRPDQVSSTRMTTFCVAGVMLSLLAADGVALAIGLTVACGAIWRPRDGGLAILRVLAPLLALTSVCLLTPAGHASWFGAIRVGPADPGHATAAAVLTVVSVAGLAWPPSDRRCRTRDALIAGLLIPCGSYLLLRLIVDLADNTAWNGSGFVLLLAGGAVAIVEGWRSAADLNLDAAVRALMRRQAGLAMTGIGLAMIARVSDLPGAGRFGLEAACLAAIGASLAGTLTSLAAHEIGASAGTHLLSRLGGLVHTMPGTSAALGAGLLALSTLPPGIGFASLWLSFQSILSAPRGGSLLAQIALALAAAALALSAALATTASVRIAGIALLGRPRTPRGAGAQEGTPLGRWILLTLGGASLLAGVLPGSVLWLLADPAIQVLIGIEPGHLNGLALLPAFDSPPRYLALPVFALLALAIGTAILVPRRSGKEAKTAGPWTDGMQPPAGLPFGEPAAQSAGAGFLPVLPKMLLPRLPTLTRPRPPPASAGIWLMLAGFAVLLLVLAVSG